MEGHLRGGFEAYLVPLAARCFFVWTVALNFLPMRNILCAVTLTGSARGVHSHPLASYFLVQSPIALSLLLVDTGVLSFLYYVEDTCLVALSDPPQTLNPNNLPLPLALLYVVTSPAFTLYTIAYSL